MRTNDYKHLIMQEVENYDVEMIDLLIEMIEDELEGEDVESIKLDTFEAILDEWQSKLKLPFDWAMDKINNEIANEEERRYDESRGN